MTIEAKIVEIAAYTLPAIIAGGVSYLVINRYLKSEENRRKFEVLRQNQQQSLPIKLQAFERMVLFLERINPVNLMMRVEPTDLNAPSYASLLIHAIQTEFEHNVTQQVYLSSECWDIIQKAKNSTIAQLRTKSTSGEVATGEDLRNQVLLDLTQNESPCNVAVLFLKQEVNNLI